MKYVIVCYDKIMKVEKEYDAVKFLDPTNGMGNEFRLKPKTKTQAAKLITALLGGEMYQNAREGISLRTALPPRVFIEVQDDRVTYVAQDREEIEVYLMDWDVAVCSDATDEQRRTAPGATNHVFKDEGELQQYIRDTKYVEEERSVLKDSNDLDMEMFGRH